MSIRRKALPVSNPQTKKMNEKSVILTEIGCKKLKTALNTKYPKGYVIATIADQAGIHRTTFTKILNNKQGVIYQKIYSLFIFLEIKLDDLDIDEYHDTVKTQERKHNQVKNNSKFKDLTTNLFTLDYREHSSYFESFLESNYLGGAFLIQGIPQGGQRWLTNRLIKQHFRYAYEADQLISIRPEPSQKEIHIDEIWENLGKKLGLKNPTPENCRKKAFQRWINGTLIIAIYTDKIYRKENYFSEFIQKFWQPLEEDIRIWAEEEDIESYLLLFLIDSANNPSAPWESQTFYSNNLTNWHPQKLIALPKINELGKTPNELHDWMKTNRSLLDCPENTKEPEKKLTNVSTTIWQKSKNGIPELVFEQIFQRCGCKWSNIEETLKL
jgi:AraC-like DNA-binding protein